MVSLKKLSVAEAEKTFGSQPDSEVVVEEPKIKTLAQLNAQYVRTREWGGYTLQSFYAVGSVSRGWTSSYYTGKKNHLIRAEKVIAETDELKAQRNVYHVGGVFSAHTPCNSNGQHTARINEFLDTDSIGCEKCLKYLEGLK